MTTIKKIGHWTGFLFMMVFGIYVGIYGIEHINDPDHMIIVGCIGLIIGALIPIIYKKMNNRSSNT
jgi:hypothetical protein